MGNTLLDFHQGITDDQKDQEGLKKMAGYLLELGYSYSVDDLYEQFLKPFYMNFHKRITELVEIDVYPYLRKLGDLDNHMMDQLLRCFYSTYRSRVVVNPGAKEILMYLSENYQIGVISNCFLPSFIYKEIFIEVGLDDYIDSYTFSYDYMLRKPKEEIFLEACQKMAVEPSQAVMIGDGLKPDIEGSGRVGMTSIWYNKKNKSLPENPPTSMLGSIMCFDELHKWF